MTVQLDELVVAYWRHHHLSQGNRAERLAAREYSWAWEAVQAAVDQDPHVLTILDALLAAPDADTCYLGAGPVEDLLVADGDRWDADVAERCRRSERWRAAVACAVVTQPDHLLQLRRVLKPAASRGHSAQP